MSNNPNCSCISPTTIGPTHNPQIKITLIVRNSQTNDPVTNATVTLYRDNDLLESDTSVDPSDGTITFNTMGNGNYNGNISAIGYFNRSFYISVDCMSSNCSYSQLLTLTQDRGTPEVTITLTWGATPSDLDLYVASIRNYDHGNMTCITFYGDPNGCEEVSLDVDQTSGGLNGPETVTLTDPSVNTNYTYVIAVNDYHWENYGASFTTSGATITVQGSDQLDEETLPSNLTAPDRNEYDVG